MKFEEISVLLPCHSLEDFPLYYTGASAHALLSAWSALWHPELIASAGRLPTWHRADIPPEAASGRLLVIPEVCRQQIADTYVAESRDRGSLVIEEFASREDILAEAATALGKPLATGGLAGDFLALGYARLMVELLTRQMRYSNNVDEEQFGRETLEAALAAVAHDDDRARQHLERAFNLLYEARKYFYPVDAYLIDLTLLDRSTADDLPRELEQSVEGNLLASAELLSQIADSNAALLETLKSRVGSGALAIVGGEQHEQELPIADPESIRSSLVEGLAEYERILGYRPRVFARRKHGMLPFLPQVLAQLGFRGAIHFTLDRGRFPLGPQAKVRWEGSDGSVIDALARLPHDAAKPESFLEFARLMGDTMDSDHVATLVFAHWPDHVSPWYQDLRRIAQISPVLGKFVTLDNYFAETDSPGRITRFEADEYRSPYLRQAVDAGAADPISRSVRAQSGRAVAQARAACDMMRDCLAKQTEGRDATLGAPKRTDQSRAAATAQPTAEELKVCAIAIAKALPRQQSPPEDGALVVNPLSFTRRVGLQRSTGIQSDSQSAAVEHATVEVPAMGFAWHRWATSAPNKKTKPIANGNVLRNDLVEVVVSRSTGGIQSVHEHGRRGNRLSEQLAVRFASDPSKPGDLWRDPDETARYSTMAADALEITAADQDFGQITSSGWLLDESQQRLVSFRQRVSLWSGSRLVEVRVELGAFEQLGQDPWTSYVAARFAWSEDDADIFRSVALTRVKTEAKHIEAPHFLEVESARGRLAILTAGLPYHRRSGSRMLDTLLQVRGESARVFRFGIGVGVSQPAAAALEMLTPATVSQAAESPPSSVSGWLFHLDARNVVATHWESVPTPTGAGIAGFRVRLLETMGQAGRVQLRAFRPPVHARQIDAAGNTILELPIEGDKIVMHLAEYEWIFVEATWQ